MVQAVQGSTGQQVVAKNLGPFLEGAIAGDDDRGPFVAFTDDLVHVLSGLGSQRIEAKVIEDQQVGLEDLVPQAGVSAAGPRCVKVHSQVIHGIGEHAVFALQGFNAQAIRYVIRNNFKC